MSIESLMLSNPCCPILLLPAVFPRIRVFSSELAVCIRWPKYWNWALALVLPMNTQGWFPLGLTGLILESSPAPQFKCINSLVFSLLYGPPLPLVHDYWNTINLSRWTFVDKVMSLFFNMLSRFVIAFLPSSQCLLISWLQSPSTVILDPKNIKSVTVSTFPPSVCHEMMGLDAMIFVFE